MADAKHLRNQIGYMGAGNIKQRNIPDPFFCQLCRDCLRRLLGISVHGGIDDHDSLLFRFIGCPVIVFIQQIVQIVSPDQTMKRTDKLNLIQNRRRLVQQFPDMRTVFPDNVSQITTVRVNPVPVIIYLIIKQPAVQSLERTEGIRGKQCSVCKIQCDHRLRPVHHGSFQICDRMLSETGFVSFFYYDRFMAVGMKTKLFHQHKAFFRTENFRFRITVQHHLKRCGMIRLPVVDHYRIQFPSVQDILQIFHHLAASVPVHRIEHYCFLIQKKIRVIADSFRNRMNVFKQRQPVVIGADPV